jgi:hypothetical protein
LCVLAEAHPPVGDDQDVDRRQYRFRRQDAAAVFEPLLVQAGQFRRRRCDPRLVVGDLSVSSVLHVDDEFRAELRERLADIFDVGVDLLTGVGHGHLLSTRSPRRNRAYRLRSAMAPQQMPDAPR